LRYLALLFLTSCGAGPLVAPEVQPYVDEYKALSIKYDKPLLIKNVDVVFGETKKEQIAFCLDRGDNSTVTINKTKWDKKSNHGKKWVVFHELAHCMHKESHRGTISQGIVSSIMYPSMSPTVEQVFELNEAYYIEELFQ
jgi:Zn-dependent protease with chaperone function